MFGDARTKPDMRMESTLSGSEPTPGTRRRMTRTVSTRHITPLKICLPSRRTSLAHLVLRSLASRTEYKTPLSPKMHPKIYPESSPKTKIRERYKKIHCFVDLSFFHILVSGEDSGCIWGVFWGSEVFYMLYGVQAIANLVVKLGVQSSASFC